VGARTPGQGPPLGQRRASLTLKSDRRAGDGPDGRQTRPGFWPAWIIPTLVGTPIIELFASAAARLQCHHAVAVACAGGGH